VPEKDGVSGTKQKQKENAPQRKPVKHEFLGARPRQQDRESDSEQQREDRVELPFDQQQFQKVEYLVRCMSCHA
jgi:hypothetical protein